MKYLQDDKNQAMQLSDIIKCICINSKYNLYYKVVDEIKS